MSSKPDLNKILQNRKITRTAVGVSMFILGLSTGICSSVIYYSQNEAQKEPIYTVPSNGIIIIFLNGTRFEMIPVLRNDGLAGIVIKNGTYDGFAETTDGENITGWPVDFFTDGISEELRYEINDDRFNPPSLDEQGRHIISEQMSAVPINAGELQNSN
jgi:hypothetical protein